MSGWRQARGCGGCRVRQSGFWQAKLGRSCRQSWRCNCPACALQTCNGAQRVSKRTSCLPAERLPLSCMPPAPHPAAAPPSSLLTLPTTMPLAASRPLWKAGPGPPSTAACARAPSAPTCRRAPSARGAAASPPTQPAPRSATCRNLKLRLRTSEWQGAGGQPAAGHRRSARGSPQQGCCCVQEAAAAWHAPQRVATLLHGSELT